MELDKVNIFETPVTAQEPKRFSPEYFAQRKEQKAEQKKQYKALGQSVKDNLAQGNIEQAYESFTQLPVVDQAILYMTPGVGNLIDAYEYDYFKKKSGRELKDPETYQLELLMGGDPRQVSPFTQKNPVSGAFSTLAGISSLIGVGTVPSAIKAMTLPLARRAGEAVGKGIDSLVPVFPAPQRMFDPKSKGYNPSLSEFDYEPGGRYLAMGKEKTDITGAIPQTGRISVGADGKPSFMVSKNLAESLPQDGKIIRTNLFKKKAGWNWTETPEGFDPKPPSDFPIVSVETGGKHFYTLSTDFPSGVELSRYAKKTSEPRLRPTTRGEIELGQKVGEISVRGKKHPVYDQITAGKAEPKDLVFVHNTSEEAIKSFDNMGGIPSPSIAVTKADQPFTGFGSIQLIGKPEKFDPLVDSRNKIYSADAYTPRAPKKLRLAKDGAPLKAIGDYRKFFNEIKKDLPENIDVNKYADDIEGLYDNLSGLTKNSLNRPEDRLDVLDRFFNSELGVAKFYKDTGKNPIDAFDSKGVVFLGKKFKKWKAEQKDKYLSQDGVFTYFDESQATTKTAPYTLDNVVENMVQETQRGGEAGNLISANRLRAIMTEQFEDLPDIKARKELLGGKPVPAQFEEPIEMALGKISKEAEDYVDDVISEVAFHLQAGLPVEQAVDKAFKTGYISQVDDIVKSPKKQEVIDDIITTLRYNAMRPVEYFEAKPTRAVGFDEFAGAIVPEATSQEVIDILEKRGLKVIKQKFDDIDKDYGKGKIRQQFKDQFFSAAPIAAAASATAMIDSQDQGIGSL